MALSGQCAYAVEGARVVLTIEQIANNRPLDNLSGTLAEARPYHALEDVLKVKGMGKKVTRQSAFTVRLLLQHRSPSRH